MLKSPITNILAESLTGRMLPMLDKTVSKLSKEEYGDQCRIKK